MSMSRTFKISYFLGFLIIAGSLSRFALLGRESLWYDEVRGMEIADKIPALGLENYIFFTSWVHPHPAGYYWLLHLWMDLFGQSEEAVRSLSAVFGILLIIAVYGVGKAAISQRVGVIASLLILVNPVAIYYSQEARMYTLVPLLTLLSTYYLYRLLSLRKIRFFILYAGATSILLYTDYLGALTLLVHLVFFVIFFLRSGEKKANLLPALVFPAVGLLYLPWLPNVLTRIHWHLIAWMRPPTILRGGADFLALAGVFPAGVSPNALPRILLLTVWTDFLYIIPALCAVIFLVTGFVLSLKEITGFKGLTALVGVVPWLIFLISVFIVPVYHLRHAFVHLPEMALILAVGWMGIEVILNRGRKTARWRPIVLIMLLPVIGANIFWSYRVYAKTAKEPWREIAADIEELGDERPVAICPAFRATSFRYYYRGVAQIIPMGLGELSFLESRTCAEEVLLIIFSTRRTEITADLGPDFDIERRRQYLNTELLLLKRKAQKGEKRAISAPGRF